MIVMPGVIYGPGDTGPLRPIFQRYLQGKLRVLPKGTAYCWGYVDDMAQAHLLAMEKGKPGETYIIAGPRHPLIEAFEIAERITGIQAPKLRISPGTLRFLSAAAGPFSRLAFWSEKDVSETLRVGAGATYLGSPEKAQRELGFSPRSLEDGLQEMLEHEMHLLGMSSTRARLPPAG